VYEPVVKPSIAALANMLRLDLGVDEALGANVVAKLARLVDPSQRDIVMLETSLQALWNLSNTPNGKTAAIEAGLLETLAKWINVGLSQTSSAATSKVCRLAAGCIMAITIEKQGKLQSLICVDPLCDLLIKSFASGPDADQSAVRDVLGALKNMAEYPKARMNIEKRFKQKGVAADIQTMFNQPIYDGAQWPASLRFQHQNVAPGGTAADDEAATRERWGYPAPFSGWATAS